MSDIMRPMSFAHLMNWILTEHHIYQTVLEIITRSTFFHLLFKGSL